MPIYRHFRLYLQIQIIEIGNNRIGVKLNFQTINRVESSFILKNF